MSDDRRFQRFCSAIATGVVEAALAADEANNHPRGTNEPQAVTIGPLDASALPGQAAPTPVTTIVLPEHLIMPTSRLVLKRAKVEFDAPLPDRWGWSINRRRHARVTLELEGTAQLESYERIRDALNRQLDTQIEKAIHGR